MKPEEKKPPMNPKDSMKNRLPISEMKQPIIDFLKSQDTMYVSCGNDTDFPLLECVDYRYHNDKFIIILTPASMFLQTFEDKSKFTGFIFDRNGRGLKMTKRVYGNFVCNELSTDNSDLVEIGQTDELVKRMLSHGAKFFSLSAESLTVFFGNSEIFTLDKDMNPSFAEYTPSGRKRYENSRHVLMNYNDRDVIFNTYIDGNTYYTLTKADSNKVEYIKAGGECQFFDGKDNHFTSKVTILDDSKVDEIFDKLKETNNSFFKTKDNLLALSYTNA